MQVGQAPAIIALIDERRKLLCAFIVAVRKKYGHSIQPHADIDALVVCGTAACVITCPIICYSPMLLLALKTA